MHLRLGAPFLLCSLNLVACQDYEYHRFQIRDTFTQGKPSGGVDILWVVDNSGTMIEEQELLVGQFNAFGEVIRNTGIDFQVGVVSTDMLNGGGLLVGPVLTPDTPDLADAFALQALLGTDGSRDEQPLEATIHAIDSALNPDFIRTDAGLHVIVLTDEDDHSPGDLEDYILDIAAVKGDQPWMVSGIAGNEPDGCHSSIADAAVASRIVAAVNYTGGVFDSICSTDFQPILQELALTSSNMSNYFTLTTLPQPDSITVMVDEALVWERANDGWQYDLGDNAIVFSGLAVPRAGQKIAVTYFERTSYGDSGSAQ